MSKMSKSIEKKFPNTNSLESIGFEHSFDDKESLLNTAIALHFIREGHFELSSKFCEEAQLNLPSSLSSQFSRMYSILDSLKKRVIEPALQWAYQNRIDLEKTGSQLDFFLHKLQFNSILYGSDNNTQSPNISKNINVFKALEYAKKEFPPYQNKYMNEIQKLMCSLLYTTPRPFMVNQRASPYKDSFYPEKQWREVQSLFTRDFCTLLGMSQDSPLTVAINVGALAAPTMMKLHNVVESRNEVAFKIGEELPVEIPLPRRHR
jgi:hypothetical protein